MSFKNTQQTVGVTKKKRKQRMGTKVLLKMNVLASRVDNRDKRIIWNFLDQSISRDTVSAISRFSFPRQKTYFLARRSWQKEAGEFLCNHRVLLPFLITQNDRCKHSLQRYFFKRPKRQRKTPRTYDKCYLVCVKSGARDSYSGARGIEDFINENEFVRRTRKRDILIRWDGQRKSRGNHLVKGIYFR